MANTTPSVAKKRIQALVSHRRLAEAEILCARLSQTKPEIAKELLEEIRIASLERKSLEVPEAYHKWFYDNLLWQQRAWAGVPVYKSPLDLWNYQEILTILQPELIIEFGAHSGGSALFFADVLTSLGLNTSRVISVDIDLSRVHPRAKERKHIAFIQASSTSDLVRNMLTLERENVRGPIFAILDGDHTKANVLAEMVLLREIMRGGDYLLVEDGDINGHPVLPEWGEGPYEAIEHYFQDYPDDYERDTARELAFGWTAAPRGFLRKR